MNKKENKISKEIKINKKSARRNYSNQTGITLIALVVTIVVLLILAGVSLNAIFSENGIIKRAQDAQNKMDEATQNDLDSINELNNWIDGKINGSSGGNTTGGDDKPSTSDLPSTSYTIPYYPDNTFTKVEGTNLSNGLVIKDTSGNEYVWIEVPKTTGVYPTAGLKITNFTETEYTAIETDLHTYTDYYRRDKSGTLTSYKDEYSSDKVEAGTGLTSAKYTELKQKMLKSVYENGGFWIGRYEAGIEENRTAEGNVAEAPLSKQGTVENPIYPYTYITCKQAQTIASKLSTEKSYTSSLMFGVQWNLVLKHIEVKEGTDATKLATIQSALRSDSTGWGNYYNATFEINRGKYAKYGALTAWYNYNNESGLANCVTYANGKSTKLSASSNSNSILLTTGASDACKKMNIYDLAGNVSEWTLEYTAVINSSCALRGGTFASNGSNIPAAYRFSSYTTYSSGNIGFRPSLFK